MLDEIAKMSESETDVKPPLTAVSQAKKINLKEAKKHELNEFSKEINRSLKEDKMRNSRQFLNQIKRSSPDEKMLSVSASARNKPINNRNQNFSV